MNEKHVSRSKKFNKKTKQKEESFGNVWLVLEVEREVEKKTITIFLFDNFLKWHEKASMWIKKKKEKGKSVVSKVKSKKEEKKCCGWFSKVGGKSSHCFSDLSTCTTQVFGTHFKIGSSSFCHFNL